jgi:adenine-specific DNA-methyltransferase
VRLQNVINGDTTGISKSVNWQGGGSFVYCELKEWNQAYAKHVQSAKSKKDLQTIWKDMQAKAFLSYRLDVKQFNENAAEFGELSLEEQKRFLLEVLDKNHLYVNLSEMDDETYGVSEEDKRLNCQFYEL